MEPTDRVSAPAGTAGSTEGCSPAREMQAPSTESHSAVYGGRRGDRVQGYLRGLRDTHGINLAAGAPCPRCRGRAQLCWLCNGHGRVSNARYYQYLLDPIDARLGGDVLPRIALRARDVIPIDRGR